MVDTRYPLLAGPQARRAVEALARSLGLAGVGEAERREAAVTVVLRLLFLSCAEARGLLPPGDPTDGRHDAWARFLATCRAVHAGYGGRLFDPARFPFLDGVSVHGRAVQCVLESHQAASFRSLDIEELGHAYESLISHADRRAGGTHYTPRELTEPLVRATLEPLVYRGPAEGRPREGWELRPAEELLELKVCDPACGSGALLVQACRYLADRLQEAWGQERPAEALRLVAGRCLFGVDRDPLAVEMTRLSLWLLTMAKGRPFTFLDHAIRCGDSLADDLARGGFDAFVCNPPFINAVDGNTPGETKARLRARYPLLKGTADLSYYFVARMHEAARPWGTVGVILPRAFLCAPAAKDLRSALLAARPPGVISCPGGGKEFRAANVRVAAVVLGGRPALRLRADNWWAALARFGEEGDDAQALGGRYEVMASMTAGMAYDLLPFVVDERKGDGPRLVTTGLIDPDTCRWGRAVCRYLGRRFAAPRVAVREEMPPALRKRVALVRRPKVLVAGVAGPGGRVEAFVDRDGRYCGAVSTFTVLDRTDDLARLDAVCAVLNSIASARRVADHLGAAAMGSGLLTITKDFLRRLPIGRVEGG